MHINNKFKKIFLSLIAIGTIFSLSTTVLLVNTQNSSLSITTNSENSTAPTINKNNTKKVIDTQDVNLNLTFANSYDLSTFKSDELQLNKSNNKLFINNSNHNSTVKIINSSVHDANDLKQFDDHQSALYFSTPFKQQPMITLNNQSLPLKSASNINGDNNIFSGIFDFDYYSNKLKFYQPKVATSINVDFSKIIVDSDILPSTFINDINNYKNKIGVDICGALPTSIRNAIFSLEADDDLGNVILHVDLGVGPTSNNLDTIDDIYSQEFILSGFKNSKANVLSVNWTQTSFRNKRYTLNDFDQAPELQFQYLYAAIYEMQWALKDNLFNRIILNYIASSAVNAPSNFSWQDIVVSGHTINDTEGTLTLSFYLSRYINSLGIESSELPDLGDDGDQLFTITIYDFQPSPPSSTILPATYRLKPTDEGYLQFYDDAYLDSLKLLIINNIENSPVNFSLPNNLQYINFAFDPEPENGLVKVNVNFKGCFEDGVFKSGLFFNKDITITGFKSSITTEFNTENLNLGNPDDIAQSSIEPYEIVENIIMANNLIINPSPTFNTSNVLVDNIEYNNHLGQLTFDATLTKYNNTDGQEQTTGFTPVNFIISGFKQVQGSTGFSFTTYNIGDAQQTIYDYVNNKKLIIDLIAPLLNNKVQDYTGSFPSTIINIKEDSIIADSRNGKITLTPVITNYFNDQYEFTYDTKELNSIIITGFKNVSETTINPNASLVYNKPNILASTFFEQNMDDLKQFILDRIIYAPNGMTIDDIIIGENSTFSNIDGTITLYITFRKWYTNEGQLITDTPSPNVIPAVISGFRQVIPTSIVDSYTTNNYNLLPTVAIDDENFLKNIVLNNIIQNPVGGTTIDNVQLSQITANNLDGTITFKLALNKYYRNDGLMYDESEFVPFNTLVTLSGFKNIIPNTLPVNNEWDVSLPNVLPQDLAADIDRLKSIVNDQIIGETPECFNYLQDITISNVTFSNMNGTVTFIVNLKNIYDTNGTIKTSNNLATSINIINLKSVSPTIINSSVDISGYSTNLASGIDDNEVIDIIFNNLSSFFINLPISSFVKDDILIRDVKASDNIGTIEVYVSSKTYYNTVGELILHSNDPMPYRRVIITGFNKLGATVVNSGVTIDGYSEILPSSLNDDQIKNIIFTNKDILFAPLPLNFSEQSITILKRQGTDESSVIANNANGTITLNLEIINYYDANGNCENNIPKVINRFVLRGFKSVSETIFDTEVTLPDVSNIAASQITNDELLTLLRANEEKFITSAPPSLNIESSEIITSSISNLSGTLVANLWIRNYYNTKSELISGLKKISLRCYGFKIINPTTIQSEFNVPGKEDVIPTSENTESLETIIWQNKELIFDNLPDDISQDQIQLEVDHNSYQNSIGEINFKIKLYYYYDYIGNIQVGSSTDSAFEPFEQYITLTGYKVIAPTVIHEQVTVSSSSSLASRYADNVSEQDLQQYIFENYQNIIVSPPPGFGLNNIRVTDLIQSNVNGTIIANVSLNLYYDQNSQLQTSWSQPWVIIFNGFKINSKVTYILPTLYTTSSILPSNIVYRQFVQMVISNGLIKNPAHSFNYNTDIIQLPPEDAFIEKNNLEGYVIARIKLKKYYDSRGNLVDDINKPLEQIITINGFQTVTPTSIVTYVNRPNLTITAEQQEEDELTRFVRNNASTLIANPPSTFNQQTDIVKVRINKKDNVNGTVTATIYINNYNDKYGNLCYITNPLDNLSKLLSASVTIAGYKIVSPTSINKNIDLVIFNSSLATKIDINEVKDQLYLNRNDLFNFLPDSDITMNDFEIEYISSSNLTGEMSVLVTLNKYINATGNLITPEMDNPLKKVITITGFKTVVPTTVVPSISPINFNASIGNDLPTDIQKEQVVDFIVSIQNNLIINGPEILNESNFTVNNILNMYPSNIDGTLEVEFYLNQYYNNLGELVDNSEGNQNTFNITLTNLQTKGQTTAIQNFDLLNVQNEIPQNLYRDTTYLTNLILDNQDDIFRYPPPNLTASDITISDARFSNLNGTITFTISLSRFYNRNGILVSQSENNTWSQEITISGFGQTEPTTTIQNITLIGYENISPTDFVANNNDFSQLIFDNASSIFSNLASENLFTKNSISVTSIKPNNLNGEISVQYTITNYYNENGEFTTERSDTFSLVINGFLSTPVTIVNSIINSSNSSITASEFLSNANLSQVDVLKQYIFDNLNLFYENLPYNANTIDDLTISNLIVNDKEGNIKFNLTISHYYNEAGELSTGLSSNFVLNNFAKKQPTFIGDKTSTLSKNGGNVYANIGTNFTSVDDFLNGANEQENEQKILALIRSSVMFSASLDTTENGVLGFDSYISRNKQGEILVYGLKITNFYDQETATLIDVPEGVSFVLTIGGFKTYNDGLSTSTILIYVAIGISSAIVLAILGYFVFYFLRRKYLKI